MYTDRITAAHILPQDCLESYETWLTENEYAPSTREKYMGIARGFCSCLGSDAVTKVEALAAKHYWQQNCVPTGVNTKIAALNNFLGFLGFDDCKVKPERIQRFDCRSPDIELSVDEYRRLLKAAKDRGDDRTLNVMKTICSTGIRVSELRFITVEAAYKGYTEVSNKGKTRRVFLPDMLCKNLRSYCRKHRVRKGSVFVTSKGRPLDRSSVWRMMRALCRDASVSSKKVHPHNLRHLFAQRFYDRTHDLDHLAVILGHSSINTTRIYTSTTEGSLRSQINRIPYIT